MNSKIIYFLIATLYFMLIVSCSSESETVSNHNSQYEEENPRTPTEVMNCYLGAQKNGEYEKAIDYLSDETLSNFYYFSEELIYMAAFDPSAAQTFKRKFGISYREFDAMDTKERFVIFSKITLAYTAVEYEILGEEINGNKAYVFTRKGINDVNITELSQENGSWKIDMSF